MRVEMHRAEPKDGASWIAEAEARLARLDCILVLQGRGAATRYGVMCRGSLITAWLTKDALLAWIDKEEAERRRKKKARA